MSSEMTTMLVMALYMFVLYYALIPKMNGGPFLDFPSSETDQKMVNVAHAIVFIAIYLLTVKYVVKMASGYM